MFKQIFNILLLSSPFIANAQLAVPAQGPEPEAARSAALYPSVAILANGDAASVGGFIRAKYSFSDNLSLHIETGGLFGGGAKEFDIGGGAKYQILSQDKGAAVHLAVVASVDAGFADFGEVNLAGTVFDLGNGRSITGLLTPVVGATLAGKSKPTVYGGLGVGVAHAEVSLPDPLGGQELLTVEATDAAFSFLAGINLSLSPAAQGFAEASILAPGVFILNVGAILRFGGKDTAPPPAP